MKMKNKDSHGAEDRRVTHGYWLPFYTEAGPLNVNKVLISGWRHHTTSPERVYRYCNLYHPDLALSLSREGFNCVFVGWSVGFSLEAERIQREQIVALTRVCHRRGIRVIPYMCAITMFNEEFFETVPAARRWVQIAWDGTPLSYGSIKRRSVACLRQSGWRAYMRRRIALAVRAGEPASSSAASAMARPVGRAHSPASALTGSV